MKQTLIYARIYKQRLLGRLTIRKYIQQIGVMSLIAC